MITCNNNLSVVKQKLRLGEQVLKDFKSEYPYIRSNTLINTKIEKHQNDARYSSILPKLSGRSCLAGLKIQGLRYNYERSSQSIEVLQKGIKKDKSANCKECATLIFDKLVKRGEKPQNIKFDIVSESEKSKPKNHTFTVIGLAENADITKPHTWGKNCVIVDGWANIVQKAQDGVEYLKELFNFDAAKEQCVFKKYSNK
ncbi:MAG: hypothetical protein NC200_06350 [Candidatus Gastranaerophilales bacterium]|nr:hypothetical protein [Candidatus Gastranaerophilales bacterium]